MNLIQYLTGNSLKFTVATDIRRLFARTYLDVDGNCAGDVSSSSVDAGLHHRSDLNISSAVPSQFNGVMPNLFGMMAKTEPESQFGRWLSQSTSSQEVSDQVAFKTSRNWIVFLFSSSSESQVFSVVL
ncbi:hypothetical protein OSTOST_23378, partial [Ostertagia ostertagi]